MIEQRIRYEVDGKEFEGAIVYDGMIERARPALFMQPNWYGVSDKNIQQAGTMAGTDYVVLIADMFGVGHGEKEYSFPERLGQVKVLHTELGFTVPCGAKGYEVLMAEAVKRGVVDPAAPKLAAGFCAGAGVLLDQMRQGLAIDAAALFHVTAPNSAHPPADNKLKARCLVLHGADDPIATKADVDTLENELVAQGVDWLTVMFAKELHSFTEPFSAPTPASRYAEGATLKSYQIMRDFFENWRDG